MVVSLSGPLDIKTTLLKRPLLPSPKGSLYIKVRLYLLEKSRWEGSGVGLRSPFNSPCGNDWGNTKKQEAFLSARLVSKNLWGSHWETKKADRNVSEYHLKHSHPEKLGSKNCPALVKVPKGIGCNSIFEKCAGPADRTVKVYWFKI